MFGRKKVAEDDPFAALKQGGAYQSTPTTTIAGIPGSGLDEEPTVVPSVAPTLPAPPAPTPTTQTSSPPPARRSRRQPRVRVSRSGSSGVSGPGRLVIWLVVLGVLAAIVVPVISATSNAIHGITVPSFTVPSFSVPSFSPPAFSTPVPPAPRPPRPTNYFTPSALRAGLARLAHRFPGARVSNLRVDSTALDAFVFPRGGGVKDVHFAAGAADVFSSSSPGETPMAIAKIPVGAVPRIVRAMKTQFHTPASRIDYIVLSTIPGLAPQWIAFSKAHSHPGFAANLDGSGLHALDG